MAAISRECASRAVITLIWIFLFSVFIFLFFWVFIRIILRPAKGIKINPKKLDRIMSEEFRGRSKKSSANATIVEEIKSQIRISSLQDHEAIQFKVFKGVNILELNTVFLLSNLSIHAVTIGRIDWELWISGVHIKTGVYNSKIALGKEAKDHRVQFREVLGESQIKDVLWLKNESRGYLRLLLACETEFGGFEKNATLLDLIVGLAEEAKKEMRLLAEQFKTDTLTGAFQRQFIDSYLQDLIDKASTEKPLTFMMIDVDHFKKINDEVGHLAGDEVLAKVAAAIKTEINADNTYLVRYGGDEFAVMLPNCGTDAARTIAEKIRQNVEKMDYSAGFTTYRPTISVGVAIATEKVNYKQLIKNADDMLRFSKQAGKNRVGVNVRKITDV